MELRSQNKINFYKQEWHILYCQNIAGARLPTRVQNSEHKKARVRRRALSWDKNNEARVVLEKTLDDIRDVGEVEGLNVNSKTKQLLVHANRGKQIVLGMPKGFYPGYDREISEIYFYDMKPRCNK